MARETTPTPTATTNTTKTEKPLETIAPSRLHYRRHKPLGRGSFGDVYRGTLDEGSAVAVKLLRSGNTLAARQFRRELRRYTQLRGVTGVVHFYGASSTGNAATNVLVTELMYGGSLRNTISRGIDPRSALLVAEMVANALACIHRRGFSHGDVSASNVLLSRRLSIADNAQGLDMPLPSDPGPEPARAKLVDFGLSRDVRKKRPPNSDSDEEDDSPNTLTYNQSGGSPPEPLGTPAYLAPEAWRGRTTLRNPKVALAADVYAPGILLYELESGEQPWVGMTEWAIFGAVYHAEKRPAWPALSESSLPELRKIAEKCWAQNYLDRPTAREVALLIRALRRKVGIASPPGSGIPSSPEAAVPAAPDSRAQVDRALQAMRLLGARSDSDTDPGEKMLFENERGEALLDRSHNGGDLIGLASRKQGAHLQNPVFPADKQIPRSPQPTPGGAEIDMDVLDRRLPNGADKQPNPAYVKRDAAQDAFVDPHTPVLQQPEGKRAVTKSDYVNEADRILPQEPALPSLDGIQLTEVGEEEQVYYRPRKEEPTDRERAQSVILASVVPESHSPVLQVSGPTPSSPFEQVGALEKSNSTKSSESQSSVPSSVPSSAFRRARKKTPANMRFVGRPRDAAQAAADIDLMQPLSPLRVPTVPPLANTLPKLKPLSSAVRQASLPVGASRSDVEPDTKVQPDLPVQTAEEEVAATEQGAAVGQPVAVQPSEGQQTVHNPQQLAQPQAPVQEGGQVEVMERTRSQIEMEKDLKYEAEMREEMLRAEELRKQQEKEKYARVQQQRYMQSQAQRMPQQQISHQGAAVPAPHIRHPVQEEPTPQIRHPVVEPNHHMPEQVLQPVQHAAHPVQPQPAAQDTAFREAPLGGADDESEVNSTSIPRSRKSLEMDYPFKAEVHKNDVHAVIYALQSAQTAVDAANALRALAVLCGIDDGNRVLAVRCHALEFAAVALARHGRSHAAASRAMCELVLQLARAHNAEVERELRNTAACEHVLNALRWHPTARGVQQAAAMALAALCRSSGALAAIVVAQNGAHAATRALARATNARDRPDGPAAVGALDAIAALSAAHAENVVRARVLTDVVVAVQRLASPAIDAAAAGVIHACARSDAGRKAMLEDGAVIAALAMLMTRARAAPDAARILALGCDAFAELAYAGGPPAADALTGGPVLEAVLMSLHVLDGAQPFHAGTVLAVRALVCLRRFAELGVDTCAELHAAHALQVAIDVVNARPENQDVAIGAAQLVAVMVGSLAKGPTRGTVQGAEAALDMLKGLDETWLLDLRVLEVVRGAINIVDNALGGRNSRVHGSDATVKMATARPGPKRLFRRKKRK